jgi:sporulation protein YlmC with PRC-barrel domain
MADSKSQNRKLHYLRDLKDYKIAKNDPDVRGWEVHDANHQSVGTVSGLVVDVTKEKVRYIDVAIDESILPGDHDPYSAEHEGGIHEYQDSKGSIHMIIPIGVARLESDNHVVVADGIDQHSLRNIPTYRYRENTPVHSEYEQSVLANFRNQKRKKEETRTRDEYNDDELYSSEHFNEDRFYGREQRTDTRSQNRKLQYLRDLDDYKIAKNRPDVRGWEVHDANHQSVGTVSGLVVDTSKEKVRYLDVAVDESILPGDHDPYSAEHEGGIHEYQDRKGSIHMIVPIGVARIEQENNVVVADGIDQHSLRNFPTYQYRENTPIQSEYEQRVLANIRSQRRPGEESRFGENSTDDDLYNSEHFNEDRFYGRERI